MSKERETWSYDFILEKKVLKFINENDGVITRDEIRQYGNTIDIPERTLSDILKKFVKDEKSLSNKMGSLHELKINKSIKPMTERENFVRIAMAIIKRDYPFRPQRLAIASKMYSRWVQRKSTKNNSI